MSTKRTTTKVAKKAAPAARKLTRHGKVASLTIARMKLTQLKPHPRNPRKHPKKGTPEWEVLASSLEHDYFDPMVWNKRNGMLVSGHLRRKVLTGMGITDADVVVVDYDESLHIARMIAANKLIGSDDVSAIRLLFDELKDLEGFNLALTGFTLPEVEGLIALEEESGEDEEHGGGGVATSPFQEALNSIRKPKVKVSPGEVWQCGPHLVICIDAVRGMHHAAPFMTHDRVTLIAPDPWALIGWKHKHSALVIHPNQIAASELVSAYKESGGKVEQLNPQ